MGAGFVLIMFSVENPHFAHISLTKQGGLIQNLQRRTIIWSLISVASGTSSKTESSDGKGGVLGKQVAQEAKIFKSICKTFALGWMNLGAATALLLKSLQLLSDMQLVRLGAPSSAPTSHHLRLMLASPSALS